ncbi:uncharacterized protein [Branchiostoma lanceolatum]|uniref:uncharacterized protein isoform X2 n=1 Tax=Branchiostoma lanceolatum TaxID=7740 RepID=UPI0034561F8D
MSYRPVPFTRRAQTVSEVLRLNSHDLDRIRTNYTYSSKTREETAHVISRFPTLEAAVEEGLAEAGHIGSTVRLCLEGAVPIRHKGKHYGIPMVFVLPRKFPHDPPTCLVRPQSTKTGTAPIVESQVCLCVETSGKITFPYLEDWNYRTSNLTTLIEVITAHFGERPPVTDEVLGTLEVKKGSSPGLPSPQPLRRTRYTSLPSGLYGIGDIFEEPAEEVSRKTKEDEGNNTAVEDKTTTEETTVVDVHVVCETGQDLGTAQKPGENRQLTAGENVEVPNRDDKMANDKRTDDNKDQNVHKTAEEKNEKTSEDVTTPLLTEVEAQARRQNKKDFETPKSRKDPREVKSAKQRKREANKHASFSDEDYMEEESAGCFPRQRSARRLKSTPPPRHGSAGSGRRVRHKDLKKLSRNLGNEWQQLAISLGSTPADVHRFKDKHSKLRKQVFSMLDDWRDRAGDRATREKLCKVLKEDNVDVDKYAFLMRE